MRSIVATGIILLVLAAAWPATADTVPRGWPPQFSTVGLGAALAIDCRGAPHLAYLMPVSVRPVQLLSEVKAYAIAHSVSVSEASGWTTEFVSFPFYVRPDEFATAASIAIGFTRCTGGASSNVQPAIATITGNELKVSTLVASQWSSYTYAFPAGEKATRLAAAFGGGFAHVAVEVVHAQNTEQGTPILGRHLSYFKVGSSGFVGNRVDVSPYTPPFLQGTNARMALDGSGSPVIAWNDQSPAGAYVASAAGGWGRSGLGASSERVADLVASADGPVALLKSASGTGARVVAPAAGYSFGLQTTPDESADLRLVPRGPRAHDVFYTAKVWEVNSNVEQSIYEIRSRSVTNGAVGPEVALVQVPRSATFAASRDADGLVHLDVSSFTGVPGYAETHALPSVSYFKLDGRALSDVAFSDTTLVYGQDVALKLGIFVPGWGGNCVRVTTGSVDFYGSRLQSGDPLDWINPATPIVPYNACN